MLKATHSSTLRCLVASRTAACGSGGGQRPPYLGLGEVEQVGLDLPSPWYLPPQELGLGNYG